MRYFSAVIALLITTTMAVFASVDGKTGRTSMTAAGCGSCHGSSTSTSVSVSIKGQSSPMTITPGQKVNLSVVIAHAKGVVAGVNLAVKTDMSGNTNAGTLGVVAGSGLRLSASELTHSSPKALASGQAEFDFTWTAPTTAGTYYLRGIGLSANDNGGDDNGDLWNRIPEFKLVVQAPSNPTLTITSPKGGESFLQGSQTAIKWTSTNTTNVNIEWSSSSSTGPWTSVATNVSAATGSYNWTVPAALTTKGYVKISDASDASRSTINASPFSITAVPPPASLTLNSPRGGETYAAGGSATIAWTHTSLNNIRIDFSSTGPTGPWTAISASTLASSNSYKWTVPATQTTQGYIRLRSTSDSTVYATNPASFTITTTPNSKSITVTNPAGGEKYHPADHVKISWSTSITSIPVIPLARRKHNEQTQNDDSEDDDSDDDSDDDDSDDDDSDDDSEDDDSDDDDSDDDSDDDDSDDDSDDDDSDDDDSDDDSDDSDSTGTGGDSTGTGGDSTGTGGDSTGTGGDSTGTGGDSTGTGGDSTGTGGDSTGTGGDSTGTGDDSTGTGGGSDTTGVASTVSIEWSSTGVGGPWMSIARALDIKKGEFEWVVPAVFTENAFVRVTQNGAPDVYGTNAAAFWIIKDDSSGDGDDDGDDDSDDDSNDSLAYLVEITSPHAGEIVQPQTSKLVTWTATSTNRPLTLEWDMCGDGWQIIANDLPGTSTQYNWMIPTHTDGSARVRIVDAADRNLVYRVSDVFQVRNSSTTNIVEVNAPTRPLVVPHPVHVGEHFTMHRPSKEFDRVACFNTLGQQVFNLDAKGLESLSTNQTSAITPGHYVLVWSSSTVSTTALVPFICQP